MSLTYEPLGLSSTYSGHVKHTLFLQKIGQHLAGALGHNDRSYQRPLRISSCLAVLMFYHPMSTALSYQLYDLPAGYSLFLHHKLQADGSDRSDIYLYVSHLYQTATALGEYVILRLTVGLFISQ
jgi:hypothetical protein